MTQFFFFRFVRGAGRVTSPSDGDITGGKCVLCLLRSGGVMQQVDGNSSPGLRKHVREGVKVWESATRRINSAQMSSKDMQKNKENG